MFSSRTPTLFILAPISAVLFLLPPLTPHAQAAATTYYVAKTGSNNHSCAQAENPATPKLTVNAGIDCLSAGDTLVIKAGTYAERIGNTIPNGGGTWATATTIQGANGEGVILKATGTGQMLNLGNRSWIVILGLVFDGTEVTKGSGQCTQGVNIDDSHHVRFARNEVRNVPDGDGVGSSRSRYLEFLNNRIHTLPSLAGCGRSDSGTTGSHGFYYNSDDGLIEGNVIYNTTGYGIQIYTSGGVHAIKNNTIRNNVIYNNDKACFIVGSTNENLRLHNNICYNSDGGIGYGGTNTKIYNNTIYNISGDGCRDCPASLVKNNIFHQVGGSIPSGNLTQNPNFVNAPGGNFHLAQGSPAIDAGVILSDVPCDKDGNIRPAGAGYDMGAYEYGSSPGGGCSGGTSPTPTPSPTPSPALCHQSSPSIPPPTGYGSPYQILTPPGTQLLISVTCGSNTTVTAGTGVETQGIGLQYVYNKGYYWNGTSWIIFTLTCAGTDTTPVSGTWCTGRAAASSLPSVPTNQTMYLVAYTCTFTTAGWKCGCRDQQCTTPYWQLQTVRR